MTNIMGVWDKGWRGGGVFIIEFLNDFIISLVQFN